MNFDTSPENEETPKRHSRRRPRRRPQRKPQSASLPTDFDEKTEGDRRTNVERISQRPKGSGPKLDPNTILMAEFNYARETAAQAMDDRHKMVNFYLIIVGVIFAAAVNLLRLVEDGGLAASPVTQWQHATSALLVTLFLVGVLFLVKLIRLRQAWRDSALAMNQIKDYYSTRFRNYRMNNQAFRWTRETLPPANKLWTVFFLSALLIILLDVLAIMGALLLYNARFLNMCGIGFLLIVIQIIFYQFMLRKS